MCFQSASIFINASGKNENASGKNETSSGDMSAILVTSLWQNHLLHLGVASGVQAWMMTYGCSLAASAFLVHNVAKAQL